MATAVRRLGLSADKTIERLRAFGRDAAWLQPTRPALHFGVALHADGISLASVSRPAGPHARPRLTRCDFHRLPREADAGLTLRSQLLQAGLEQAAFRLVLNPDEYQLHLVESPEVPAAELREALRWRVRELIDFSVDEAALDAFDLPPQFGRAPAGGGRAMCVVAARSELIAQKAALIARGGCELELIDIPELALRNLLALNGGDARGTVLLYVQPESSLIVLCADGALYLSRRIGIGQRGLAAGGADALALELLRSLEYYESHFARPPAETLLTAPLGAVSEPVRQHLEKLLTLRTQELDLNTLLDSPSWLTPEHQTRSLLAIGAALRHERST